MIIISGYTILTILIMLLLLHLCIIAKLIPYQLVWGGRLKTDTDMYRYQSFSIIITAAMLFFILTHMGFINLAISKLVSTIIYCLMAGMFFMSFIGNLKSTNRLERLVFAPISIFLVALILVQLIYA